MFILVSGLVSGFVFQLEMLPLVMQPKLLLDAPELLVEAWRGPGIARAFLEGFLEEFSIFSLMVLALFLPAKSFFSRRTGPTM